LSEWVEEMTEIQYLKNLSEQNTPKMRVSVHYEVQFLSNSSMYLQHLTTITAYIQRLVQK